MTLIRIFKPNEKDIYNELYTYQKECGLNLDSKFLKYICDKNSNNLFSAAQIIEKLSLIDEIDININDQNLNKLFSSDSQYSSFLLFDYCIKADYVNILNSINFLKSNKISVSVIIWVFIRKFHEYTRHINKIEQGASIDEIVKNIWPYEQKEITRMALSKFSIKMIEMYISMFIRLDMQSKNLVKGDTWLSLKDLCIAISKNKLSILKLN
jgi:DNA polymerase III delta subunit